MTTRALTVPLEAGLGDWPSIASGWPLECSADWLAAESGRVTERQYMTTVEWSGELVAGAVWCVLDGSEERRGYSLYDLLLGSELESALSQLESGGNEHRPEAERLRTLLTPAATAPSVSVVITGSYEPGVAWSRRLAPPDLDTAVRALVAGVQEAAGAALARNVTFVNVPAETRLNPLRRILAEQGYLGAEQAPTAVLDIPADGIPGYLSRLKRRQRKNIAREMRRFDEGVDKVTVHDASRLLRADIVQMMKARYEKYGHQTSVAAIENRLERARALPGMTVLVAECAGRACAFAAFAADDAQHRIVSRFAGCEPNDFYAYFNISYYQPIRHGAALGLESMTLGTESYYAKLIRGCRIERRMTYSRPLDPGQAPLIEAAARLKTNVERGRLLAETTQHP